MSINMGCYVLLAASGLVYYLMNACLYCDVCIFCSHTHTVQIEI